MPFASRELSVLAYANGFTLWHYRSADPLSALTAPDGRYFAAADEVLRPGDQIILTLQDGSRAAGGALVVTGIRPGVAVDVAAAGASWPATAGTAAECIAAAELPLAAASEARGCCC